MRIGMWHELKRSASTEDQRVPACSVSLVSHCRMGRWAQGLSRQDDELAQLGSLVSRWPSGSGPGTISGRQRHVRPLEPELKSGLELSTATTCGVRASLAYVSLQRYECMRSGARADGGFKPGNHAFFSPCSRWRRVNHRRQTRTWRQQVQSSAAPSCSHVRVQHESTWLQNEEHWPERTCRPRVTRWRWTSFTSTAPRPSSQCFGPNQEPHEAPDGLEQSSP
jgi:hypothetical protein